VAAASSLSVLLQRGRGALAALARPRHGTARAGPVRVASVPLTPQGSVHVVQWQGEEFLLGCTVHQVTLLAQRPVRPREAE
jgi:hypothetical protein